MLPSKSPRSNCDAVGPTTGLTGSAAASQVRTDPKAVLKLRCLFLKLRSMLELPLLRIGQDKSPAAARVGDFYSASLLTYVRKVLQVRFVLHYIIVSSAATTLCGFSCTAVRQGRQYLCSTSHNKPHRHRGTSDHGFVSRPGRAFVRCIMLMAESHPGFVTLWKGMLIHESLRAARTLPPLTSHWGLTLAAQLKARQDDTVVAVHVTANFLQQGCRRAWTFRVQNPAL